MSFLSSSSRPALWWLAAGLVPLAAEVASTLAFGFDPPLWRAGPETGSALTRVALTAVPWALLAWRARSAPPRARAWGLVASAASTAAVHALRSGAFSGDAVGADIGAGLLMLAVPLWGSAAVALALWLGGRRGRPA